MMEFKGDSDIDSDTINAMTGLTIQNTTIGDGWESLHVEGEIDLATVGEVERAIKGVFDDGASHLALDLTSTSFMDSTGLRSLVVADRQFHESDRKFVLVVNAGPISRLIDLSGLDSSLRVVESLEAAKTAG